MLGGYTEAKQQFLIANARKEDKGNVPSEICRNSVGDRMMRERIVQSPFFALYEKIYI